MGGARSEFEGSGTLAWRGKKRGHFVRVVELEKFILPLVATSFQSANLDLKLAFIYLIDVRPILGPSGPAFECRNFFGGEL